VLFPTHLAAGYVAGRWTRLPAWPVVLGAALPDVLDKPLALLGITDLFHSVGHSALAVGVVGGLALVARLTRERRGLGSSGEGADGGSGADSRDAGPLAALWLGWAGHLALDAVHMVVNGRPADVQFLLWPAVRHVPAVNLPPGSFAAYYVGTPSFFLEGVVWAALLWTVGRPWLAGRR
jgi:hypothetical protein